jgi:hypothetical protein
MTNEEWKLKIDAMSYETLLRHWRSAPVGHPMFAGEIGDYAAEAMRNKKAATSQADQVAASKRIGW